MQLVLRLPGESDDSDIALAPLVARLAALHAAGRLSPAAAPAVAPADCDGPDCRYIETFTGPDGKRWRLYLCGDDYKVYPA